MDSKRLVAMQPAPTFVHNPDYCNCCTKGDIINASWFLWVHYMHRPGQVIAFESLTAAYKYAEDYAYLNSAKQTRRLNTTDYYGALWTAANGVKWEVEGMEWTTRVCDIVDDIEKSSAPDCGLWLVIDTNEYKMLIGRGVSPPPGNDLVTPHGYTVAPAQQQPKQPTPISLGPYTARKWYDEDPGERSPNLLPLLPLPLPPLLPK